MKKWICAILLCTACLASIITCAARQEVAAKNVIRLQVIANSDSDKDQAVKLLVRDRLLSVFNDYTQSHTQAEAENYIQSSLSLAQDTAKQVLSENDFSYDAVAQYGEYDFPVRQYGDITLPAGRYRGLRILLGEASGKNWWCVMYPPLCFNALNTKQEKTKDSGLEIQLKFKILELLK